MQRSFSLVVCQINASHGNIPSNLAKIESVLRQASTGQSSTGQLFAFPALALTGAPLDQAVYLSDFQQTLAQARQHLLTLSTQFTFLLGLPSYQDGTVYSAYSLFYQGCEQILLYTPLLSEQDKAQEQRIGQTSIELTTQINTEFKTQQVALSCTTEPSLLSSSDSLDLIVVPVNKAYGSFELDAWYQELSATAQQHQTPVLGVQAVGGQDELIFIGASAVFDSAGQVQASLAYAEEAIKTLSIQAQSSLEHQAISDFLAQQPQELERLYQALVLSVRDYVQKNNFPGVVLGLSGGIDSALVLALTIDAIGADKVHAVMMPYTYTSEISILDARQQAQDMGCSFDVVPIRSMVEAFMAELTDVLGEPQHERDTAEQNIQARCRGIILMGISNRTGKVLLTTGNKSELAVGYCTLYGDMNGGFGPLKDVLKTQVYALSRYRNTLGVAIPERVITRPPSAELAPDQEDQDYLPDYDTLDAIIYHHVEQNWGSQELIDAGFDKSTVHSVLNLIQRNEYKRKQGAIGPKVSSALFGYDRKIANTHGYLKAFPSKA